MFEAGIVIMSGGGIKINKQGELISYLIVHTREVVVENMCFLNLFDCQVFGYFGLFHAECKHLKDV